MPQFWQAWKRRRRIASWVEQQRYDYRDFGVIAFCETLMRARGQLVIVQGFDLGKGIYGLWVPYVDVDYLIFNETLPPI
jgi:hypothetical protein